MLEVKRQTGLDGNIYRIVDDGCIGLNVHLYSIEQLKDYVDCELWIRVDDMYHKGEITSLDAINTLFEKILTMV